MSDWLSHFFSDRNTLKWTDVTNGPDDDEILSEIRSWINHFSKGLEPNLIVLPVVGSDQIDCWYAMASNQRSSAVLRDEIKSFIGVSYSNFSGFPHPLNNHDVIEKALGLQFGKHVYFIEPIDSRVIPEIRRNLCLYLKLNESRPVLKSSIRRPFGRIRSDFDIAIVVGNKTEAVRLKEELLSTGRINAEQQKYLEIRFLAGLGEISELAQDSVLIRSVMDLSPPAKILSDLIDALYSTHICSIERGGEISSIISVFHETIGAPFGALFRSRKGITNPNVLKAFLLNELSLKEPDQELVSELLTCFAVDCDDKPFLDQCALFLEQKTGAKQEEDYASEIKRAFGEDDYDAAYKLCLKYIPNLVAYRGLLRCVDGIQDEQVRADILIRINEASREIYAEFNTRDLDRLKKLRGEGQPRESDSYEFENWTLWAKDVSSGQTSNNLLEKLKELVPKWDINDYRLEQQSCEDLAGYISNSSRESGEIFREALSEIVDFFVVSQDKGKRVFLPIYLSVLRVAGWSGVVSDSERELAYLALQALIESGPPDHEYTEAVDSIENIFLENKSFDIIDWALNVSELLSVSPTPDSEIGLRFFVNLIELSQAYRHRLTHSQRVILELLAQDYQCEDLLGTLGPEVDEGTDHTSQFSGLIGIYTLTVSAATRAKEVLERLFPRAKVDLNSDFASSDRLVHLAKESDVFVFAWKSSKHQAYYAAKTARGDKKLLLPTGKGSASILNCIFDEISKMGVMYS